MAKGTVKAPVPSPTSGNEVANPDRFGSDPMQLHLTMIEVQREVTVTSTVLKRLVEDLAKLEKKSDDGNEKLSGKITDLKDTFNRVKWIFIGAAGAISLAAGVIWWLVGEPVTAAKQRILAPQKIEQSLDSKK